MSASNENIAEVQYQEGLDKNEVETWQVSKTNMTKQNNFTSQPNRQANRRLKPVRSR